MSGRNIPTKLRYNILKRDHFTCQYCGRSAPDVELHVDHLYPQILGGHNDPFNLLASCDQCNLGKSRYPLSKEGLKEKQDDIVARMSAFHKLHGYPLSTTKQTNVDLYPYPNKLLRTFKAGIQAFPKQYTYTQDKTYHLEFVFDDDDRTLIVQYIKQYKNHDQRKALFEHIEPFSTHHTQTDYNTLFEHQPLTLMDELISVTDHIMLFKDSRGFVVLTILNRAEKTFKPYVFFVPFKQMNFLLTITSNDE